MTAPPRPRTPPSPPRSSGSSSAPPTSTSNEAASSYAMSMWFEVTVDVPGQSVKLGKWSSCTGLAVRFKTEPVPSGTGYDRPRIAPIAVEYPEVTLERAVHKQSHPVITKWLQDTAKDWVVAGNGADPDKGAPGASVRIELFSALSKASTSNDHLVATWTLTEAFPVAWTGPTLTAKGSDLALEKLTLAHRGFLSSDASSATDDRKTDRRVTLTNEVTKASVTLQFMPSEMTIDKSVVSPTRANTNLTVNPSDIATDPSKLNVAFSARVEGADRVKETSKRLFDWIELVEIAKGGNEYAADVSAARGAATSKKGSKTPDELAAQVKKTKEIPPPLRLSLPKMPEVVVTMRSVSMQVKKFSSDGAPIRAVFALKLEVGDPRKDLATRKTEGQAENGLFELPSPSPSPSPPPPPPPPVRRSGDLAAPAAPAAAEID